MRTGNYHGLEWLLRQPSGYFVVYGCTKSDATGTPDNYHFLAVNVPKRLVINNKTAGSFMRLCKEVFDAYLPYVHEILRCEKLVDGEWKVNF